VIVMFEWKDDRFEALRMFVRKEKGFLSSFPFEGTRSAAWRGRSGVVD
jgi:hypothetical protein